MTTRASALAAIFVFALAVMGCIDGVIAVHGSGEMESQEFEFDSLSEVRIGDALDVEVSVEPDASTQVTISIDANLSSYLVVEDRQGVLVIETTRNIRPSSGARIQVTVGQLELVEAAGASNVTIPGVVEEAFVELQASGASSIRMADPTIGELRIHASGASQVAVTQGRATLLRLEATGASTVDTARVEAIDAEVQASGASEIEVAAARSVTGQASGASTVAVFGSPGDVDVTTSGASSVDQR